MLSPVAACRHPRIVSVEDRLNRDIHHTNKITITTKIQIVASTALLSAVWSQTLYKDRVPRPSVSIYLCSRTQSAYSVVQHRRAVEGQSTYSVVQHRRAVEHNQRTAWYSTAALYNTINVQRGTAPPRCRTQSTYSVVQHRRAV